MRIQQRKSVGVAAITEGRSRAIARAMRAGVASVEREPTFATSPPRLASASPDDMPAIVKPKASPLTHVRFSRSVASSTGAHGDTFASSVAPWNSLRVRNEGVGLPDEPVVSPYQTTRRASGRERNSYGDTSRTTD